MAPVVVTVIVTVVIALVVLGVAGMALWREAPGLLAEMRTARRSGSRRPGVLAATRRELSEAADASSGIDELMDWSDTEARPYLTAEEIADTLHVRTHR